jgi:HSP20 family protein
VALVRSDPFRDIDRMFQQLWTQQERGSRTMAVPMDAYRKEGSFVLELDLPGVKPDSVELTVEDDMLTIRAERPAPPEAEDVEPVISERPYGRFTRQVLLGGGLDTENIHANYENGVVTVVLPIAKRAEARRVEVKTESGPKSESDQQKNSAGLLHRHKGQGNDTKKDRTVA